MKLELKHLAVYLPYGLNVVIYSVNEQKKDYISGIYHNPDEMVVFGESEDYYLANRDYNEHSFKPILRPFSDLNKEIEFNQIKITPIVELCKIEDKNFNRVLRIDASVEGVEICYIDNEGKKYFFGYRTEYNSFYFQNKHKQYIEILHSYNLYQKLHELHFDTFGLISAGLAVDINSL